MYQLDFSGAMQIIMTIMIGALGWFIQRSIRRIDDALNKNADDIKQLRQEFNDYLKDAPLVFALREDFIRVMGNVEEKLNRILYGRNGGGNS